MRLTTLTVCSLTVLLAAGISEASEIPTHQVATETSPAQEEATMPVVLEKSLKAIDLQRSTETFDERSVESRSRRSQRNALAKIVNENLVNFQIILPFLQ